MMLEFGQENFEEWVKQGLKISHGINLDLLHDDEELPFLMPTAPVAFAMVLEEDEIEADPTIMAANNVKGCSLPAMIPLPMNKFSVVSLHLPEAECLNIRFKASWTVDFVKPGRFCHFFLAVPIPNPGQDPYKGFCSCKIQIPNCSNPDVEHDYNYRPMFGDVHFIQRKNVDGGAEGFVDFSYTLRVLPVGTRAFSFSFPLRFPFYANGFRGEQEGETRTRRCKIRLYLNASKGQVLQDYSITYPLKVIHKEEDTLVLLQESEGSHVKWPDQDFGCTFSLMAKKASKRGRLTSKTAEPSMSKKGTQHECPTYERSEPERKKAHLNESSSLIF